MDTGNENVCLFRKLANGKDIQHKCFKSESETSKKGKRLETALIDVRGCRHSGFRHSGFSPRGLDVRGSDVRGRLFRTLGFRTFGVFENGRSGLNPERLKLNAVSLNPERPKTPNVRK